MYVTLFYFNLNAINAKANFSFLLTLLVFRDLVTPVMTSDLWECRGCGKTFPSKQLEAMLQKLRSSLDKVPADNPDKLESFLKVASKILHSNHCILVEVKQRLMSEYGTSTSPALVSRIVMSLTN